MKKPNFFIIGAPKCGTTSLASWLSEHPKIFMTQRKEPHYFNTDFDLMNTLTLEAYEQMYEQASDSHIAVGEASTHYLYSANAVDHILAYCPAAKFIVMVRNPVEMAHALYGEKFFWGEERIGTFERAWKAQARRLTENYKLNHHPRQLFMYGSMCKLGEQLQRLFTKVNRNQVCIIVLDDMQENPQSEYLRVLDFLDVPVDSRTEFPILNTAKNLRIPILQQFHYRSREARLRKAVPPFILKIIHRINRWNWVNRSRVRLSHEMRAELKSYFQEDIQTLSTSINKDLTHWLT